MVYFEFQNNRSIFTNKMTRLTHQRYRAMDLEKYKYEYALQRIEELLPLVDDSMPPTHPDALELSIVSDYVIAYEKKHYPIGNQIAGRYTVSVGHENG